jgi:NAD(P)-dependent dehydrogenase (short-subunit alcohol dehydrogenase family)
VNEAWERLGGIDALVNSIGVYSEHGAFDVSRSEWQRCLDTNLVVPFFTSTDVARRLVAAKRPGSIVNLGSGVGVRPAPFAVPYGAAKAAVTHMTRSLAAYWGPHAIRVNCVIPGVTATPMTAHLESDAELKRQLENSTFLRRLATPDDIAAAVSFLVSPESSYVTGAELVVDGGFSIS